MKKALPVVLLVGAVTTYYILGQNKSEAPKQSQVTQKVQLTKSAIKKNSTEKPSVKEVLVETISTEKNLESNQDLEKKKVLKKLVKLMSPEKLNKTFEMTFAQMLKNEKSQEKKDQILSFLKGYPFQEKMEVAYSELTKEELDSILEIQDHPLSQKMTKNQIQIQKKVMEHLSNKSKFDLAPEKRELVDGILDESSVVERAEETSKGIVETALAYTLSQKNGKLSPNEAMGLAKDQSPAILKAQRGNIELALDIAYDSLSKDELQTYLTMLQRTDAKKVTKVAMKASDKVYKDFIVEFLKNLK